MDITPSAFNTRSEAGNPGEGTGQDDVLPAARFENLTVSETSFDGEPALEIQADVVLENLATQEVQVAFFFYDTNRNVPLRDFNDRYSSQRDTVAVGTKLRVQSNSQHLENLKLVVPISELHLVTGKRFEIKVTASVSSEQAWADYLAISDWTSPSSRDLGAHD